MKTNFAGPLTLAACLTLSGCNNGPPGGGFINENPGIGSDKAAIRSDSPDAAASSKAGEALSEATHAPVPSAGVTAGMDLQSRGLIGSDTGGTGTDGGTGARNGGRNGSDAAAAVAGGKPPTPPGTPPTVEAPSGVSASGETKPAGDIKVGTPKGPQ